jgi:hypothetical protein
MEPTLWDVEDVATLPAVRDTVVRSVSAQDVGEFCRRYHYTRSGTGAIYPWHYGLWHGLTLLGIVGYNLPPPGPRRAVFGPEQEGHIWHMGRLALADAAPRNSESRLIGGSLGLIQAEHPRVWAVLTYADTSAGHIGYVYQATNAIYTGTGGQGEVYYVDRDGRRRTCRNYRGIVTPAQAAAQGLTRGIGAPKHRYVYILGSRTQRRQRRNLLMLPVLPYPKAAPLGEEGDAA